jgi:hypothetical protein
MSWVLPPLRVTKQSPRLPIQEFVVRPEPTLADIATALEALHKNIQALSQQLDHLENDTVHKVNNYICQCTNIISDYLTANFGEIRADRYPIHALFIQARTGRSSPPLDEGFFNAIVPGAVPVARGLAQATSRLPIQNLALPREPNLADIMRALDALHKNIQALSQQISRLEHDLIQNIKDYIYECTKFIGLNNLNPNFLQMALDRIWIYLVVEPPLSKDGYAFFGEKLGGLYIGAGNEYSDSFARQFYTPIDA